MPHRMPQASGTDRKITFALVSASTLVLVVAAIGVLSTGTLIRDARWVAHTQAVRGELHDLWLHIDAAKGDVRGFLLTDDSSYLGRYRADVAATEADFGRLEQLTTDNAAQRARLAAIRGLLIERVRALDETIVLPARPMVSPGVFRADVARRLAIGEALAQRIDSLVASSDTVEQRLLTERSVRQTESEWIVGLASTALAILAVAFAFVFRRSIRRDLTGRLRAEAALRASEAKFAGILSLAGDAIVTIDENDLIVHFNRGATTTFGYDEAEVLGKPLEMLLPARHTHTHRVHVASFAASSDTARRMGERRQVSGRRKSGEEFPADVSISKLMTPDGMLFTAVLRDVTDRKLQEHYEHALVAAGEQLAQSLDYEDTLISVANLPVPWVGVWSMLAVIEPSEIGDEPVLRRVASRHPDAEVDVALREWEAEPLDWDTPEAAIDVLRTGQMQRIEATEAWVEAHFAGPHQIAIARRAGVHSLLVVPIIARDVVIGALTIGSAAQHQLDEHDAALAQALAERAASAIENARLFQSARRATAARDQVLSVVSHDLRNPLSAVSMLAHRLVENPPDEAERRSIGANIIASADWMHRMLQDLLDVSSIEAGRLSVEIEPHVIHDIVDAASRMFAAQAAAQSVTLVVDVPATLPRVRADAARVVQVLDNLIGNALKYTPPRGTVTIAAQTREREVLVTVRDTGSGIPAEDLPHVFDRFWHARRGSATRGTGLGLAIAQGIVRAHGGRIWIESGDGVGTTVHFTLDAAAVRPGDGGSLGLAPSALVG